MAVHINTLNGGNITITTTPSATPSSYFAYDSNRVITGLYQGSPNVQAEGGWTYGGGSNMVENYATAIGDEAFDDNDSAWNGTQPAKAITGNITFQNVTNIGNYAFRYCYSLTSVTMPNVTSIGEQAFYYCLGLTNITIGSGIQGIGGGAFNTNGTPITLTIGKTVAEVQAMEYSDWGLPSGSTIVCTDDTITIY